MFCTVPVSKAQIQRTCVPKIANRTVCPWTSPAVMLYLQSTPALLIAWRDEVVRSTKYEYSVLRARAVQREAGLHQQ
jgi:hypothetical protein